MVRKRSGFSIKALNFDIIAAWDRWSGTKNSVVVPQYISLDPCHIFYCILTVLSVTVPDQYFCTKHPDLNITARENKNQAGTRVPAYGEIFTSVWVTLRYLWVLWGTSWYFCSMFLQDFMAKNLFCIFWPVFRVKKGPKLKSMAKCRLWVYNAEIFCGLWTPIRTSDLTAEAKFKKVFWTP